MGGLNDLSRLCPPEWDKSEWDDSKAFSDNVLKYLSKPNARTSDKYLSETLDKELEDIRDSFREIHNVGLGLVANFEESRSTGSTKLIHPNIFKIKRFLDSGGFTAINKKERKEARRSARESWPKRNWWIPLLLTAVLAATFSEITYRIRRHDDRQAISDSLRFIRQEMLMIDSIVRNISIRQSADSTAKPN